MDGEKKNSFKVLTTSDIRKHAQHWSLAGDVGLLAHLEQFSQNVCNKTQETQKYLNELIDNYEKAYTNIGNITNQFLALQNCQFVENRVYDEETPTEEKAQGKKAPDEAEQERLLLTKYKEAVEVGVKLLDTHFQEVQLPPNSDSDEEDEEVSTGNSLIWKPKNPYAAKKFPLLIGSNEWWADDTVGLGNLEENLDTDKLISESESDAESIEGVEKRIQSSSSSSMENEKFIPTKPTFLDSSSEDLFGLSNNDNYQNDLFGKGSNSLLAEPEKFSPSLEKQNEIKTDIKTDNKENSFSENQVSEETAYQHENLSKTHSRTNDAFTRELAAKLGSVVANKNEGGDKQKIEKKSEEVEKPEEKKSYNGESLFDEPDDVGDLFSGSEKIKSVGSSKNMFFDAEGDDQLFSGSNDLFFEAGSIFDSDAPKKSEPPSVTKISEGKEKADKTVQKTNVIPNKKSLVDDLFEDINDNDTLFDSKPKEKKQGNEWLPYVENNSFNKEILFVPENLAEKDGEGLFDSINNDFGNDLLAGSSFSDSKVNRGSDFRISVQPKKAVTKQQSGAANPIVTPRRQIPDEPTPIFESNDKTKQIGDVSNFFSSSDKKISFLEDEEDRDRDDLFSPTFKQDSLFKEGKKTSSSSKLIPVSEDDDSSLFADKPKDSVSISSSRSSLFDEVGTSKTRLASVFEKDKNSKGEDDLFNNDSLFEEETSTRKADEDLFSKKPMSKIKEGGKSSLFDDFDDSDDLFGPANEKSEAVEEKSLFEKPKEKAEAENNIFDAMSQKKSESVHDGEAPKKAAVLSKTSFANDLGDSDLFSNDLEKTKVERDELAVTKEPRVAPEIHKTGDKTKLRESKSDIFGNVSVAHSGRKFFDDDLVGTNSFKKVEETSNDTVKPMPPTSLSFKRDASLEKSIKTKSVGKLNIPDNLKIKFESMAKSISSGEAKPEEKKVTEDFDNPIEPSSNLLKCPSKDRVKIPGRRRPQSRRARQEAIRNSGTDFGPVSEDEKSLPEHSTANPNKSSSCVNISQSGVTKISSEPLLPSPSVSNPLSPSTDEEDYFNVPELDTRFEKEDQGIFRNNLFQSSDDSKLDDNLLFDGAPVLSPVSPKKEANESEEKETDGGGGVDSLFAFSEGNPKLKPKGSIFDDEEEDGGGDDDSLFKNEESSKSGKGKPREEKSAADLFESGPSQNFLADVRAKKPLFDADDLDDEDDLFGGNSKSAALFSNVSVEKISKITEKNIESKDRENQSFVDPLGLMSED